MDYSLKMNISNSIRKLLAIILVIVLLPFGSIANASTSQQAKYMAAAVTTPGDVDGNGIVDSEDVELVTQYVVGQISSFPHPENADATEDGKLNIEDALAIQQWISGKSQVVVVSPEHGLPGELYVGSTIRIEAFERFFPFFTTGGTVRIISQSTGYDSGSQALTFEQSGRSLYYHWGTGGLKPAADYKIYISLTKAQALAGSINALADENEGDADKPDETVKLSFRPFEPPSLSEALDANAPAPGISLEFRRVFPHDSSNAPYLGPLGRGWVHNYDIRLEEYTNGHIAFCGPNGSVRWFMNNGDGTYTASPGDYAKLVRDPDGTFQMKEKNGFLYRFRANLRLDYIQDSNGNRVSCSYDTYNRLIEIKHSNGQAFQLEYNSLGRISKLIDQAGRATTYQYDDGGTHLLRVTMNGDRTISYTYSLGQSEASDHRLLSITFPDGTHAYNSYDLKGRLTAQEGDGGTGRTTYEYGDSGITSITDASGATTAIQTNEHGQPVQVTNPLGAVAKYEYDSDGHQTKVTDALNHSSSYTYDNRGNVSQVTDALGNQIKFGYEPKYNKLTSLLDSRGNTTSFSYNASGNLLSITYPDDSMEQYTYDDNNRLQNKKDRKGQAINYTFDDRGLLLSKTYPDGTSDSFTYDNIGRTTSATNHTGTTQFQYDDMDRLISATYPGSRSFKYTYDAAGKRTSMTDPDGKITNYKYDEAGRLIAIKDSTEQKIVEYDYDKANRRTKKTLGNGAYTTYDYDAAGQITHLINYGPAGNIISRFDYTYDAAGNRVTKGTNEGVEKYNYDVINQLTGVEYPDGKNTQFEYDAMGNRLRVTDDGVATNYSVNNLNQYTRVGSTTYGYDANGNLTSESQGEQTTYYDYNYENQLIKVRTSSRTINYTYDAFGLRNSRSDSSGAIRYLWDGDQVAIEEDSSYQTQAKYVWGDALDEAIRMDRGSNSYYYAQDAILSVSDLLDKNGSRVEHYIYSAFGEPLVQSALHNPWLFTGLHYDFSAGLQYNRARYYSPALGRFTMPDPINVTGGINLYSYVANNSISYVDPYGYQHYTALVGVAKSFPTAVQWDGTGTWIVIWGSMIVTPLLVKAAITVAAVLILTAAIDYAIRNNSETQPASPRMEFPIDTSTLSRTYFYRGGTTQVYRYLRPAQGSWVYFDFLGGWVNVGGMCPTFIQLPSNIDPAQIKPTHLDISKEKLAGKITVPIEGALLRSDIPIFGVAGGTEFKEYKVEYGVGTNPAEWHLIESSTTPEPKTDVGLAEIGRMQGDVDIRGNLATWNTGLKNWVHLPWHPADDPTDLNGIYTLRLTVLGKDGQKAEDKMVVEVGRAIAQCLPGISVSSDKKVAMRFPEQSIMEPFRVFPIIPLLKTDTIQPLSPQAFQLVGETYRIKEPGDRFIKDVALEFSPSSAELKGRDTGHFGIARYDVITKEWIWLDTHRSKAGNSSRFIANLNMLPTPEALYALAYDPLNNRNSATATEEAVNKSAMAIHDQKMLVNNAFEKDVDGWKSRDRYVGAAVSRIKDKQRNSYVLKIASAVKRGNNSVTVLDHSFDVSKYPIMSFDYRISSSMKTDFYFLVNNRWYNIKFTDDPIDFRNRDVNIANLGRIEGIKKDDKWRSASVNIYKLLKEKTKHTRVDAIVMADWDVSGFMKLEFGHNAPGAAYYIDNFKIAASTPTRPADTVVVNSFDSAKPYNQLGGSSGTFSKQDGKYVQARIVADSTSKRSNKILKLDFDTTKSGTYSGYWTTLRNADFSETDFLSLRIRASKTVPPLLVGLLHGNKKSEAKIKIQSYLSETDENGWREVAIPLTALVAKGLPDRKTLDTLSFTFENKIASGKGTVYIDDIKFTKGSQFKTIADFAAANADYSRNLLGGKSQTMKKAAALIWAGSNTNTKSSTTLQQNALRISYGGLIGLDYGGGNFSYALWETGLLGFDAQKYSNIVLRVRGGRGDEKFNIWLDDGTTRRCVTTKDIAQVSKAWQDIRIPLKKFSDQSIDSSHLENLQVVFEWERMNGTIYIEKIRFE